MFASVPNLMTHSLMKKLFLPILAIAWLGACTTVGDVDEADRPYVDASQSAETPANPAVEALKLEAHRQLEAGNAGLAANALERAIRIAPRDAGLRQQLAAVRLQEGDPVQAKSLARMAVVYAQGDPEIQAAAWEVIGRAEVVMGNRMEADLAFDEAQRLRGQR